MGNGEVCALCFHGHSCCGYSHSVFRDTTFFLQLSVKKALLQLSARKEKLTERCFVSPRESFLLGALNSKSHTTPSLFCQSTCRLHLWRRQPLGSVLVSRTITCTTPWQCWHSLPSSLGRAVPGLLCFASSSLHIVETCLVSFESSLNYAHLGSLGSQSSTKTWWNSMLTCELIS